MTWQLISTDYLSVALIRDTFARRVAGIRIAGYCSAEVAQKLSSALLHHNDRTNYQVRWVRRDDLRSDGALAPRSLEETDVTRVGPADSNLPLGENLSASYEHSAAAAIREMRSIVFPCLAPVDRLRLELDEILPLGAGIYRHSDGVKAMVGIGRVMQHSRALVHADTARADCLTANVYLRLPTAGGQTRIWNHTGEFTRSPGSYLFAEGEIPETAESVLVEPAVGELVIWNPLLPHVVLPFSGGPRVSIQTWIKIVERDGQLGAGLLN